MGGWRCRGELSARRREVDWHLFVSPHLRASGQSAQVLAGARHNVCGTWRATGVPCKVDLRLPCALEREERGGQGGPNVGLLEYHTLDVDIGRQYVYRVCARQARSARSGGTTRTRDGWMGQEKRSDDDTNKPFRYFLRLGTWNGGEET